MGAAGRVRVWRRDQGWGVLDSEQTPGGCWAHFSVVRMPGFKELRVEQEVEFEWVHANQDGYRYRAVSVSPTDEGETPDGPAAQTDTIETAASRSRLLIDAATDQDGDA